MWKKLQVCCYFQAASFLLVNYLGSHCLLWLKEFKFRNQEANKKWETGASGRMWIWGCGGSLSCLFPLLVKLVSMAGTQGRHCWEWWLRVFWPYGWLLLERPDAETGSSCLMFIWGTERKSLLDFSLPSRSMGTQFSLVPEGKRNNAKFQPNFWANSLQTAKEWGSYPQTTEKEKEIPAFGKGRL